MRQLCIGMPGRRAVSRLLEELCFRAGTGELEIGHRLFELVKNARPTDD